MLYEELKDSTASTVGHIVLAYSSLEFDLALRLFSMLSDGSEKMGNCRTNIERMSFKQKSDRLIEVLERKMEANLQCLNEFKEWHKNLSNLRVRRNALIHGRWGFIPSAGEIANVEPGLPNGRDLEEIRYTCETLQQELEKIRGMTERFHELCKKWQIA